MNSSSTKTRHSRREVLAAIGSGFGMLGLNHTMTAAPSATTHAPHFAPKAKHVIYLFLNGGPSQVDTFDPKPMLTKYHGKPAPSGNLRTERKTGALLASPFQFPRCGKSGIEISEIFSELGKHADDLCVIRSMHTERPNHEPSLFMLNCGHVLPGHPSMGSWLNYGLGTENQNLPGFVVLCPGLPVIGPQLWNSAFLPPIHQGTYIPNQETEPEKLIQHLRNTKHTMEDQRKQLDLLASLNRAHARREGNDPALESRIESMEIAYRMQGEAMDAFDVRKEPEKVRERYGDGPFARGCLLARRLVERGVRMVQVYYGDGQPWDNHDDILIHRRLAQTSDKPMAALLQDLKDRGLLQETVVIIGGEFGRTPSVEVSGLVKFQNGRDHNNHGFSLAVAGGGFRGGITYGATDEFGFKAVDKPVHPHDLHATILHLMGMDHTRLTYRHSGRDFRLTDVAGNVIKEILA
ncbi:MAG: DUF1501 domain-containing protein [Candidatus Solibacter usitatus]|nr:DUF1501 domain-containing protein [Candidatus Solibacter usitatus]